MLKMVEFVEPSSHTFRSPIPVEVNRFLKIFKNLKHFSLYVLKYKMLVFSTGIHKMLVRIINMEDPDQTASSEAVWFGSALFV